MNTTKIKARKYDRDLKWVAFTTVERRRFIQSWLKHTGLLSSDRNLLHLPPSVAVTFRSPCSRLYSRTITLIPLRA